MEFIRACDDLAGAVRCSGWHGRNAGSRGEQRWADGTPTKRSISCRGYRRLLYASSVLPPPDQRGTRCAEMGGESGTIFLIRSTAPITLWLGSLRHLHSVAEDGVAQAGYVQNLATGETFHAVREKALTLTGVIHVSKVSLLEKSAMSVYGRKFDPTRVLGINQKIRRWRLLGASALELCYVGCGRIDGFIDVRGTLRVTDAAAGMLVCEEAGGRISDLDGNTLTFPDEVSVGRSLVATNSIVHNKVIEYLR